MLPPIRPRVPLKDSQVVVTVAASAESCRRRGHTASSESDPYRLFDKRQVAIMLRRNRLFGRVTNKAPRLSRSSAATAGDILTYKKRIAVCNCVFRISLNATYLP